MHRILLLEDHVTVSQVIAHTFKQPEYKVSLAKTLAEAHNKLAKQKFELLIIDINLPDGNGLDLVKFMREYQPHVPLLVLSHRSLTQDRILGLRFGADDYLPKPFAPEELQLRVDNLLRKTKRVVENALHVGKLQVMPDSGKVLYRNRQIPLRKRECDILTFLAKHKNVIVSRERLIEHIWVHEKMPTYKSVDVYVRRLRSILGNRGRLLKTVRGYGYVLQDK